MDKLKIHECEKFYSLLPQDKKPAAIWHGMYDSQNDVIFLPHYEDNHDMHFRTLWHELAHREFFLTEDYNKYKELLSKDDFEAFSELVAETTSGLISSYLEIFTEI
jgi:hypothetical protein